MKLGFWVTLVLVGLMSISAHANKCDDGLFKDKKPARKSTKAEEPSKKQLNSVVEAVAGLIEKSGRIPTEKEIAREMGVPVEALKAFLSKETTPDIVAMVAIAKQSYPNVFKLYEAKLAKTAAQYLEKNNAIPNVKELAEALNVSQKDVQTIYGGNKDILARISEYERKTLDKVTDGLVRTYVKAARVYGRSPTMEEVAGSVGSKFSLEALQSLIGKGKLVADLGDLHKIAENKNPKSLRGVVNLEVYNDQRFADLMKDITVRERYVVSSSVAGAQANPDFLGAIQSYNKLQKASLFVRPINNETGGQDPALLDDKRSHIVISEINPAPNVRLSNIPLIGKLKNPNAGLADYGPRGQIIISGGNKAQLDVIATKENIYSPHMVISTGSLNDPDVYQGQTFISGRTDAIAAEAHFMGAVIVEKTPAQDNLVSGPSVGDFHFRFIQYIPEKKGFMDLNRFYTAEGSYEVRAEAVAFGDTHVAQTDHRLVYPIRYQILSYFKPKKVVLHDLFDGQSISHYERDKVITLSMKAQKGELNLQDELDITVDYVRGFIQAAPADTVFYVPDANHNNWLMRYIQAGQFMHEPHNTKLGIELAMVMASGKNPLEYYFEKALGTKYSRRIIFLKPEESLYAGPEHRRVLLSEHGDRGANGAKGSLGSFVRGTTGSAQGHTHFVQVRNNTVYIGTNSKNPSDYAKGGMSNWVQGVSVIGPNGEQQLLMFRNKEWFRDPSRELPKDEEFFEEEYPKAKQNNKPTNAVQVDQYSQGKK